MSDFSLEDCNRDNGDIGFDHEYVCCELGFSRGESEGIKWHGGCCDGAVNEGFRWSAGLGHNISVM
jgi:hypothetical protein